MKLKVFQKGFNVSQDGPGNRLVYHLQGCNMRCIWCTNPESFSMEGSLMVKENLLLDSVCPFGAIEQTILNREQCINCSDRLCITKYKNKGIRLSYMEIDLDEILQEAMQSKALFFGGGGVTFTGGEATLQFEPLKELMMQLKQEKISIVLETNGTHKRLQELFPYLDKVIIDLKHYDSELHKYYTGIENREIIKNIKRALLEHENVLVRIPLIWGVNQTSEDACGFADIFSEMERRKMQVELLPYHEYGIGKWKECGLVYQLENGKISLEELDKMRQALTEQGFTIVQS